MDIDARMLLCAAALGVLAFFSGHGLLAVALDWQERRARENRLKLLRTQQPKPPDHPNTTNEQS